MTTHRNLASEQTRLALAMQKLEQDYTGRSAEESAVTADAWAEHVYQADNEQMRALAEWQRKDALKRAQTPRRPLTWRDVRAFVGMLVILGLCGGALWLFTEWQALGGGLH